jgi:hypothetical protein
MAGSLFDHDIEFIDNDFLRKVGGARVGSFPRSTDRVPEVELRVLLDEHQQRTTRNTTWSRCTGQKRWYRGHTSSTYRGRLVTRGRPEKLSQLDPASARRHLKGWCGV